MKITSINFNNILLVACLNLLILPTNAQIQKGDDIDGEAAGDQSGWSVSMPDANTIAIGAFRNDGNGDNAGHVRIYSWSGTAWEQKGTDIDGEESGDGSGCSVSMPDANTIAIGASSNDGNGHDAGHVRIYSWSGTAWVQKGTDIDGESAEDYSGRAVSMPDANTIASGSSGSSGSAGQVRIYSWSGTAWVQKGVIISGLSVSMPDANTVAVETTGFGGNGDYAGNARIYSWCENKWVQKGVDIIDQFQPDREGEAAGFYSRISVSMPDANTIAIGAPFNHGNGNYSGHVRIFYWSGSEWLQKGANINGEASGDNSGEIIIMPDANTVAIGAPYNKENGNYSGHVRVYTLGM